MAGWYRLPNGSPIGAFGKTGSTTLGDVPELRHITDDFSKLDFLSPNDEPWLVIRTPESRMISATYQRLINMLSKFLPRKLELNKRQYLVAFQDEDYWISLIDQYFEDTGLMGPLDQQHHSDAKQRGERTPWHIPPMDMYHTANYLIYLPKNISFGVIALKALSSFLERNHCSTRHKLNSQQRLPGTPHLHKTLYIPKPEAKTIYETFKTSMQKSRAWPYLLEYLEPEQKRYDSLLFLAPNMFGIDTEWRRSIFP